MHIVKTWHTKTQYEELWASSFIKYNQEGFLKKFIEDCKMLTLQGCN
jgi:hypothetical protein